MFKDVFNNLIQSKDVTAYKISKETGISEALISNWRSGRQLPKYDNLKILADYFDVSADFLLERTNVANNTLTLKKEDQITEQERKLLFAYRQNPNMQGAVNKLLGIQQPMRAIKIARSNNSQVEEVFMDFSDILNAPETDEDL